MKLTMNPHALPGGQLVEFVELYLIKTDPGNANVPERYNVVRNALASSHRQLKETYARDRKSQLTEVILGADGERDDRLVELFGILRHFSNHPSDAGMRNAAKAVYQKLLAYGTAADIGKDDIMTESATIDKILADLRGPLNIHTAQLPIAAWITALDESNTRVQQAYLERGDERAVQEVGAFKKLRQQTIKAFRALNRRLELYGEDAEWAAPWKELRERVLELFSDFERRIAQRAVPAQKQPEAAAN